MKKSVSRWLPAFLLVTVSFVSCKEKARKVIPVPDIPVVKVLQKDVPVYKEFVGQIYGKYDIPIRARVSGFLEGIHFTEGSRVKKGQLLYTIDPQPFEAQVAEQMSRLAGARTQLVKAKNDLQRIRPLAEISAVSKSDLDAAEAQYEAAQAEVDAAKASLELARISLSYTRIKSPIRGLIGKTQAKVGEFVGQNPNPVILNTVSRIDTVHVEFFLPERDYLILAKAYSVNNRKLVEVTEKRKVLQLILSDGSTFPYKGWVNFINRNIDPSSGSMLIQASFPNPQRILRPGLFARIKVRMDVMQDALLVPLRCILEIQNKYYLYVVEKDGTVRQKEVEAGPLQGDMQVITKGLAPEDRVVLEGIQMIRSGMKVNPVEKSFRSQSRKNL